MRRAFLGHVGGLAGGLLLARTRASRSRGRVRVDADVVVVGAGLAGLATAAALQRAGHRVLVLEAQSRVGGRVDTLVDGDTVAAERGAEFVNADMRDVLALAARAGVRPARRPARDTLLVLDEGGVRPPTPLEAASHLDPAAIASVVRERDRSVGEALVRVGVAPGQLALARSALVELLGVDPDLVSGRAIAAIGTAFVSRRDPDEMLLTGGVARLAATLASSLAVRLDMPVTRVVGDGALVHVESAGATVAARYVVLAVPAPVVQARIALDVPLPVTVRDALGAWIPGAMVKSTVHVEGDAAPPGAAAISVAPPGCTMLDASRPGERGRRLVVFAGGEAARSLAALDDADARAHVRAVVRRAWPVADDARVHVARWVDHPWCGGGYNSVVRHGAPPDAARVLREHVGAVQFAGSELAPRFPGYMEGALRSGTLVAARIADALRRSR
jgi:monoamine oxidase